MLKYKQILFALLFVLLLEGLACGGEEGGTYFDLGVFAFEEGKYAEAGAFFRKALERAPDNPLYLHHLGKTYVRLGRYSEASRYLERARRIDPELQGLAYDLAYLFYVRSEFSRAIELFQEVIKDEPSNVLAHYYIALCFLGERDYQNSLKFLYLSADMSPGIRVNAYYYAGVCYVRLKRFDEAVERFRFVKEHGEDASMRKKASRWLDLIERQTAQREKPYDLYIKLGYGYDDNVRLEPIDSDLFADEEDRFFAGYFSGKYDLFTSKGITTGVGYNHYEKRYADLKDFNLRGSIFQFYGNYASPPFTFSLSYVPYYYWLDADSYLMRHQVGPSVFWKMSERIIGFLKYAYLRDNYFSNNRKDGHSHTVDGSIYYDLLDGKGYLFGGLGYADKSASHPDESYSLLEASLGISLELPWYALNMSMLGKAIEKDYDNVDSAFNVRREDTKYLWNFSLYRTLFYEWLEIKGEVRYTRNDSNIGDFDYKRHVYTISLGARF